MSGFNQFACCTAERAILQEEKGRGECRKFARRAGRETRSGGIGQIRSSEIAETIGGTAARSWGQNDAQRNSAQFRPGAIDLATETVCASCRFPGTGNVRLLPSSLSNTSQLLRAYHPLEMESMQRITVGVQNRTCTFESDIALGR